MVLNKPGSPLEWWQIPERQPGAGEIRLRVTACGVCRTDLHVVDGDLPALKLPIIPGHEIVGRVDAIGAGVKGLHMGERVGVPWLGYTCGSCPYCIAGRENLCDHPLFTGYARDGGFATATIADARYAFALGTLGMMRPSRPGFALGSSAGVRLQLRVTPTNLAFTVLVPRRISLRRLRSGKGDLSLHSRGQATLQARNLRAVLAPRGREDPMRLHPPNSMLPLFSRRLAH